MEKQYSLEEIKDQVMRAWEEIKRIVKDIANVIRDVEYEKELRRTWHVPTKITKDHQVMNRKPLNVKARAQI